MFGNIMRSGSPLFGDLRRLEQELDEIFGNSAPWTGGIRSLPPGAFPAINVGSTPESPSMCSLRVSIQRVSTSRCSRTCSRSQGQREISVNEADT